MTDDFTITVTPTKKWVKYNWTATINGNLHGAQLRVTDKTEIEEGSELDQNIRTLLRDQYERTVKALEQQNDTAPTA